MKNVYCLKTNIAIFIFLLSFISHALSATPLDPNEAYYPTVCYNSGKFNDNTARYKMWFQKSEGGIGLAYSENGSNWNEQAINGLPSTAARPFVIYDAQGFDQQSIYYKMWYWETSAPLDSIAAIKWTTSIDGINWTTPEAISQDLSHPLVTGISPGYFYHLYGPGFILYQPNSAPPQAEQPYTFPYVMFFESATEGFGPGNSQREIGLAYSNDGIYWMRYGTAPLIIPSDNSSVWNGLCIYYPLVYKLRNVYTLYYLGSNVAPEITPTHLDNVGIGRMTSVDGILWTADANASLSNANICQLARKFASLKK